MLHAVARPLRLAAPAALLAACQSDPISWADGGDRSARIPPPSAESASVSPDVVADSLLRDAVATQLACASPSASAAGCPAVAVDAPMLGASGTPPAVEACPGSLRLAAGREGARLAAWWAPRPEGRAWLLAARSVDEGRTWSAPIPVDTLDRSASGCDRPAPSVALDVRNGFAHVTYTLVAPEGEGVFYAHQMDPRAGFEPPRVVVYGDRSSATGVASDGDLVAVAYEDPNTNGRPFVSMALSRTGGHTFDARFAVSGRSVAAVRPHVAVRGARVAVGWVERPSPQRLSTVDDPSSAAGGAPGFVVVRAGTVR